MPTYEFDAKVAREYLALTPAMRRMFLIAVRQLVEDLRGGGKPRPSLRVKRVATHPGVWEMSWAPDGRATFEYGPEVNPGDPHVIWRRVGSHDIFRNP